jgi:hypothetical protein
MVDTIIAHAGSREWIHGFLFRWCQDRENLIELARDLGVSPAPFVQRDEHNIPSIGDWSAVYEAVVDRAVVEFEKNMHNPRAKAARRFGDLLTIPCGQPTDAESAWLADLKN